MNTAYKNVKRVMGIATFLMFAQNADAAIALDRTRVIFEGGKTSTTVSISNQNKSLPYLAQAWVEDAAGNKIESPLTAVPPLQRVESGEKGQVKIQGTSNLASLPQDRESLYYFNVREIPPKSSKPNTLQLALQTRVKMFYRPTSLAIKQGDLNEAQKKLTLIRSGDGYKVNNPTPYYVTIVAVSSSEKSDTVTGFQPFMVAPKSESNLGISASSVGSHPVLTFINDFGGRPQLLFNCNGNNCAVDSVKAG